MIASWDRVKLRFNYACFQSFTNCPSRLNRVYFNVQFYTKCAVLNPFVQFLKHKCAVTKLTKIAFIKTVSSHLLVTLVDAVINRASKI